MLFGVSSFLGSSGFAGFFVVFFVVPLSCLALAKQLTEQQGGTIFAESTPGEGSTFTVRLPRAKP